MQCMLVNAWVHWNQASCVFDVRSKFLVDARGNVVKRYPAEVVPLQLAIDVYNLLIEDFDPTLKINRGEANLR